MEATLERELRDIRQTLLDYRRTQPESNFIFCLANDERYFYGFADRDGEILFETTKEAFAIFSKVFTLVLLRIERNQTMMWGLKASHIEKVDEETGLLLVDILVQDPKAK